MTVAQTCWGLGCSVWALVEGCQHKQMGRVGLLFMYSHSATRYIHFVVLVVLVVLGMACTTERLQSQTQQRK